MKTIYYLTHQFYLKILPENYSGIHLNVVTAIGLALSFYAFLIFDVPFTYIFCYNNPGFINVLIILSSILMVYFYYKKYMKKIETANMVISIQGRIFVILFYLLSLLSIILASELSREIYSNC